MIPRQRPETVTILGVTYRVDYDSSPPGSIPFTKDSSIFKVIEQMEQEQSEQVTAISGWDYRIVKQKDGQYAIHEAYFDEQEKIEFSTRASPQGHGTAELAHDLAAMVEALGKPVLDEAAIEAAAAAWAARTEVEIAEGKTIPWEQVKVQLGLDEHD